VGYGDSKIPCTGMRACQWCSGLAVVWIGGGTFWAGTGEWSDLGETKKGGSEKTSKRDWGGLPSEAGVSLYVEGKHRKFHHHLKQKPGS